jgi:DNA-binding transcriptional regulator YiaG
MMQISRDAETIGLLFKAMAHYGCATVTDLAQHFSVAAGPSLLEALGIDDDTQARWAEVADLGAALWYRPAGSGEVTAVASTTETPDEAEVSADAFAPLTVQQEPLTALRTLRETVGLTVQQLAAKVGVPASALGDWERGAVVPEARQVGQLAQALGVAPEQVLAVLPTSQDGA